MDDDHDTELPPAWRAAYSSIMDKLKSAEVFEGERLPIASRADAAVSKLVWIDKGSHKSRRDLRQIFRTAGTADRDLIRELADQLEAVAPPLPRRP